MSEFKSCTKCGGRPYIDFKLSIGDCPRRYWIDQRRTFSGVDCWYPEGSIPADDEMPVIPVIGEE